MPAINLPNNQSAILYGRDEISERTARSISRSYMKAAGAAATLVKLGFDESNPDSWSVFSNLEDSDRDSLDGYQAALIVGMVQSWSLGDLPTLESALDLPKNVFDALATACADEFNGTVNTEPSLDPKAPTAD
jgi:hypothetical protein